MSANPRRRLLRRAKRTFRRHRIYSAPRQIRTTAEQRAKGAPGVVDLNRAERRLVAMHTGEWGWRIAAGQRASAVRGGWRKKIARQRARDAKHRANREARP